MKSANCWAWPLALLTVLIAVAPALAVEPIIANRSGRVTEVAAAVGTLQVQTHARILNLLLTPETQVFLNNHTAQQAQIVVGDRVDVRYDFNTLEVIRLVIHRAFKTHGRILAAANNSVTLRQPRAPNITSQVNAATELKIEKTAVDSATLFLGLEAHAKLETISNLALRLDGHAPLAKGKLNTMNAATGAFTVDGGPLTNFMLHQQGRVTFFGRPVTLASLAPGDRLKVGYATVGNPTTALIIQASGGPKLLARGRITALGGATITVNTAAGPVVLSLSPATRVTGRKDDAGDLRVGDKVKAKYVPRGGLNTALKIVVRK